MASRSLLHKSKLDEFKNFLLSKAIATRPGKGSFQVMQIQHPKHGWQPLYEKLHSPEHYSVPDKLIPLVMEFVHPPKGLLTQPAYKAGQVWYVLFNGASALSVVEITDVTSRTVQVKDRSVGSRSARYVREAVDFVEEVCTV